MTHNALNNDLNSPQISDWSEEVQANFVNSFLTLDSSDQKTKDASASVFLDQTARSPVPTNDFQISDIANWNAEEDQQICLMLDSLEQRDRDKDAASPLFLDQTTRRSSPSGVFSNYEESTWGEEKLGTKSASSSFGLNNAVYNNMGSQISLDQSRRISDSRGSGRTSYHIESTKDSEDLASSLLGKSQELEVLSSKEKRLLPNGMQPILYHSIENALERSVGPEEEQKTSTRQEQIASNESRERLEVTVSKEHTKPSRNAGSMFYFSLNKDVRKPPNMKERSIIDLSDFMPTDETQESSSGSVGSYEGDLQALEKQTTNPSQEHVFTPPPAKRNRWIASNESRERLEVTASKDHTNPSRDAGSMFYFSLNSDVQKPLDMKKRSIIDLTDETQEFSSGLVGSYEGDLQTLEKQITNPSQEQVFAPSLAKRKYPSTSNESREILEVTASNSFLMPTDETQEFSSGSVGSYEGDLQALEKQATNPSQEQVFTPPLAKRKYPSTSNESREILEVTASKEYTNPSRDAGSMFYFSVNSDVQKPLTMKRRSIIDLSDSFFMPTDETQESSLGSVGPYEGGLQALEKQTTNSSQEQVFTPPPAKRNRRMSSNERKGIFDFNVDLNASEKPAKPLTEPGALYYFRLNNPKKTSNVNKRSMVNLSTSSYMPRNEGDHHQVSNIEQKLILMRENQLLPKEMGRKDSLKEKERTHTRQAEAIEDSPEKIDLTEDSSV